MDDEFGDASVAGGSSIFPFLSVLFCTLGALILILIAGSLNATVADATQEQKFAKVSEEHGRIAKADKNLTRSLTDLQRVGKEQEELRRKREETAVQTQGERASLSDLRRKRDAEKDKVAKKQGAVNYRKKTAQEWEDFWTNNLPEIEALNILRTEIDKLKEERQRVDDIKKGMEALEKKKEELETRYKNMLAGGAAVDVSFRVEGVGAGHVPVYLDLTDEGPFVHRKRPAGTGEAPTTQPDRVAASFNEVALELARGPGDEFVLLLVRPDQQEQLRAAERSLMRRRVPFVLEPADQAWKLIIKDGNGKEAEVGAGDPTPPETPPE